MNTATALSDLDELVLFCRDDKARVYIVEAVACYRSGAYRSAIVATWIAVCYDIIDKLRELSLAGDAVAENNIIQLEQARANNNVALSLNFERDILDLARDKFDLISPIEHIDLKRLQEDRNRCAHPSLISEDQSFNPSAELARLHIRSAVLHLLQHQPVQGKYALERLLREVGSPYFPNETSKALQALSSGPLKRPRDSLVRNFVVVLLKNVLSPALDWAERFRFMAALSAVKQLHHRIVQLTLEEKLPSLFRALQDDALPLGVRVLLEFNDCWNIIPRDVQVKFEAFVGHIPQAKFDELEQLLTYSPLREQAIRRVQVASIEDIKGAFFFDVPPLVADRIIELYLKSKNYKEANELAPEI